MTSKQKYYILRAMSWVLCFGVPIAVISFYFPLFVTKGVGEFMSGLAVMLLLLAAAPVLKYQKQFFKKTPAAWVIWGIIFILLYCLNKIIDQLIIVSAWGAVGNLIGGVIYKASNKYREGDEA
jgi:predicted ABC-type exoprotein transport system permease subunit